MFLTKKSIIKIVLIAICYFIIGTVSIVISVLAKSWGIESNLLYIGIVCYALIPIFVLWGRYAEGKGKLINLGNKVIRNDLEPAKFIEHYEILKSSPDLVISKPSIEILNLIYCAYELLDEKEKATEAIEEMLSIAPEKKKNLVKLMKASHFFDCGRVDEAEALFTEVRSTKMDFTCKALSDLIMQTDRAKALGDYKTAELANLKKLEQSFPKLDNAGKLIINFSLGEIYEKTNDIEKAIKHYSYCSENGGQTAVRESAREALARLKNQEI